MEQASLMAVWQSQRWSPRSRLFVCSRDQASLEVESSRPWAEQAPELARFLDGVLESLVEALDRCDDPYGIELSFVHLDFLAQDSLGRGFGQVWARLDEEVWGDERFWLLGVGTGAAGAACQSAHETLEEALRSLRGALAPQAQAWAAKVVPPQPEAAPPCLPLAN